MEPYCTRTTTRIFIASLCWKTIQSVLLPKKFIRNILQMIALLCYKLITLCCQTITYSCTKRTKHIRHIVYWQISYQRNTENNISASKKEKQKSLLLFYVVLHLYNIPLVSPEHEPLYCFLRTICFHFG